MSRSDSSAVSRRAFYNFFWYQAQLANQVYQALDRAQRARALLTRGMPFYMVEGRIDRRHILPDTRLPIPLEPDVRFKGPRGTFPRHADPRHEPRAKAARRPDARRPPLAVST